MRAAAGFGFPEGEGLGVAAAVGHTDRGDNCRPEMHHGHGVSRRTVDVHLRVPFGDQLIEPFDDVRIGDLDGPAGHGDADTGAAAPTFGSDGHRDAGVGLEIGEFLAGR